MEVNLYEIYLFSFEFFFFHLYLKNRYYLGLTDSLFSIYLYLSEGFMSQGEARGQTL